MSSFQVAVMAGLCPPLLYRFTPGSPGPCLPLRSHGTGPQECCFKGLVFGCSRSDRMPLSLPLPPPKRPSPGCLGEEWPAQLYAKLPGCVCVVLGGGELKQVSGPEFPLLLATQPSPLSPLICPC